MNDFELYTFINMILSGTATILLLCLYQDFMWLWAGEENILPDSTMYLMVMYFYVWHSRRIVHTYKDAAGIWNEDKFRPLVEGIVNVTLNVLLINIIGLDGVIISTILSMICVGIIWENNVFIKAYLEIELSGYYIKILQYGVLTFGLSVITFNISKLVACTSFSGLFVKAICLAVCIFVSYCLIYKNNEKMKFVYSFLKIRK